jgi:hypothetical protein
VHWFVTNQAELEKAVEKVVSLVAPSMLLWIYYPKGSSGVQTDLTRDKGWDSLLKHKELSWINLVSFDDTWAAFACRLKTEKDRQRAARPVEKPGNRFIDAKTRTVTAPPDLASALKENKNAGAFFNGLAYSHRKEYVEWIVTAKKEETRAARVQGTVERLLKNWKNPRNL